MLYLRVDHSVQSREADDWFARQLAARTGVATLMPDLGQSSSTHYGATLDNAYEVLCWVADQGTRRHLDCARVAVAGFGLGGHLATSIGLLATERAGPALRGQALLCPAIDPECRSASYEEFAVGYHLSATDMRELWRNYLDRSSPTQSSASPLLSGTDKLSKLPATLIITAEFDVLRDEGENYAAALRAAGVPVTASRYLGTIDAFMMLGALRQTPTAQAAVGQSSAFLSDVLVST